MLDRTQEEAVAQLVGELQDEAGYDDAEWIPGLAVSIRNLATDRELDEVIEILEEN